MKKTTIFIVLAVLCLKFQVFATQDFTIISPNIGDSIPQVLMNLKLRTAQSERDNQFTFNSLKKRLIILDFWGEYCASCIKALPEYEKINSAQNNEVKIVAVSDFKDKPRLLATLKKFKLNLQNTPTLLTSNILKQYFPHKIIPHAVWILDGKLFAVTEGEYIKIENINKALSPAGINLPTKGDAENTNLSTILSLREDKSISPKMLYYSAFSSFIPGIASPITKTVDEKAGTFTFSVFNTGLLGFCRMAVDNKLVYNVSDFSFDVSDSSRFIYDTKKYLLEWKTQNSYSYTVVVPLKMPEAERKIYIQEDLKRWLKLMGIEVGKFKGTESSAHKYWIKEINKATGITNQNISQ